MCHRRQKSVSVLAARGQRKFSARSKPSSFPTPRAMSVYPEKSKYRASTSARA